MAMKEWLQWLPPPRSLLALLIAIAGFSGRLFASHFTHSPTLLVDTCHSLCRLVGLITTLLAYKYERADEGAGREGRLRNTFGWARIEVVGRLSVHVLFASFALSLVVNALQLGVHSSHIQPPKYPRIIVASAVIGLLLHAINYMLLAGRELSYSRRLSMTEGGGVVLKTGSGEPILAHAPTDIASSLFVMGAGLTLEWEQHAAGIVDPALSACAAIVLVIFNYPFMRSAGLVLLQTVPEGLGTCALRAAALGVPGVLAIHELHVWQLHRERVVATAHIVYGCQENLSLSNYDLGHEPEPCILILNDADQDISPAPAIQEQEPETQNTDYRKSSDLVSDLFKRHGISQVTLQPEFTLSSLPGSEEEKKSLIDFANTACSGPCAKECIAPRCCEPPRRPSVIRI